MSTTPSKSIVRAIKNDIADLLMANPYFANIPVYVIIPKNIFSQIEQGVLPLEVGIVIFIEAFRGRNENPDIPGPWYENGHITVTVVENPTLNATQPDCDEVSETAQGTLHLQPSCGGQNAYWVSDPSEVEDKVFSIRRFTVTIPVGLRPVLLPNMPAITATPAPANGMAYPLSVTLALAAAVPGAAIFYTLDGSFPSPLNPTAQIYTGPIAVASAATTVTARAYLAGYNSGQATPFFFN